MTDSASNELIAELLTRNAELLAQRDQLRSVVRDLETSLRLVLDDITRLGALVADGDPEEVAAFPESTEQRWVEVGLALRKANVVLAQEI